MTDPDVGGASSQTGLKTTMTQELEACALVGGKGHTKMVQVRGVSSSRNPPVGLAGGNRQIKMVQFEGASSNQLFETLADWNRILQGNPYTELL
jgi:hypothetical protein